MRHDVPTWEQVLVAKEQLMALDDTGFAKLQTAWSRTSTQTWNLFAALAPMLPSKRLQSCIVIVTSASPKDTRESAG